MDLDERRIRLLNWLEAIKDEVQDLMLDQQIFWEVQAIISANPQFVNASGLFNQWMASSYVQSAAMGVRRQAKTGDDCVSLKRLLNEVKRYPSLVSRQFYLAFFSNSPRWLRETNGDEYFSSVAGDDGAAISTALVDQHLLQLAAAVDAVEHYADRRIAHYDARGLRQPIPTFKDLDNALKTLESLVVFYWTLLKGVGMTGLTPTIQDQWRDVFEFPWVEVSTRDGA